MKLKTTTKSSSVRKRYEAAQRFLAVVNSSYGIKIRAEKPHLVKYAEEVVAKNQMLYIDSMSDENESVVTMKNEIQEAKAALNLISETSHDAIKELNELIFENSKMIQDTVLFNPNEFYNQYFFSVVSSHTQQLKDVTQDDRFKLWFANSKCTEPNGMPQIFYHGTGGLKVNEFDEFKFSPFPGAYFAENKSYADWFAKYRTTGKSVMYLVYLRVSNPIDLTPLKLDKITYDDFTNFIKYTYGYDLPENKMLRAASNKMNGMLAWQYLRNGVDWLKHIKNHREFDGFVYFENNPQDILLDGSENFTKAWLVLHGNQIKTADSRNQIYSLESNSIKMKRGGEVC